MNHHGHSYFCMTKVVEFNKKTKNRIAYRNIPSAMRPILHSEYILVSATPETWQTSSESGTSDTNIRLK